MNDNVTIFALALASNSQAETHLRQCLQQLEQIGTVQCSSIYVIPCRDGIGADYYNAACLLRSNIYPADLIERLKAMEHAAGRLRPSHQISLDIDLIAWGNSLDHMQFNHKKMPLALDVKIPMAELWPDPLFAHAEHQFPMLSMAFAMPETT